MVQHSSPGLLAASAGSTLNQSLLIRDLSEWVVILKELGKVGEAWKGKITSCVFPFIALVVFHWRFSSDPESLTSCWSVLPPFHLTQPILSIRPAVCMYNCVNRSLSLLTFHCWQNYDTHTSALLLLNNIDKHQLFFILWWRFVIKTINQK